MVCNERQVGDQSRWMCSECVTGMTVNDLINTVGGATLFFIAQVILEEHGMLDENSEMTPRGLRWISNPKRWDITDPVELLALAPVIAGEIL